MSISTEIMVKTLESLDIQGGVVPASICQRLCEKWGLSIENLMIALLPIASRFSKNPVSNFGVGAVVEGERNMKKKLGSEANGNYANLYLGSNIEFENQALCHTIHAEQSAVAIAWSYGETAVNSIATSAVPCGHCRQFLYELSGKHALAILTPKTSKASPFSYTEKNIAQLLPDAFGPVDLGCHQRFMEKDNECGILFITDTNTEDHVLQRAISSAKKSYSPYTKNFAGCAILLNDGNILAGSSAENVAFNPSLLAFSVAVIQLMMGHPKDKNLTQLFKKIKRVVLIEKTGKTSQKDLTNLLLSSYRRDLNLEYYLTAS